MAMGNNLDIAIERTNVDSANQAIQAARGAFDPVLRGNPDSITPRRPPRRSSTAPPAW